MLGTSGPGYAASLVVVALATGVGVTAEAVPVARGEEVTIVWGCGYAAIGVAGTGYPDTGEVSNGAGYAPSVLADCPSGGAG